MDYSDKRHRYKSLLPSDFASGTPRFDNPQKFTPRREPIVPASTRPRDAFHSVTAPKPPEPPLPPEKPQGELIPTSKDFDTVAGDAAYYSEVLASN